MRLDVGNDVVEQIVLEGRHAIASPAWPGRRLRSSGPGKAVWHDDDHWNDLLFEVKIVENRVGRSLFLPTRLVVSSPVEEIEHGELRILGIPRRRINDHLPLVAGRLRVVFDRLRNSRATGIESLRRRRQRRLIGLNRNRTKRQNRRAGAQQSNHKSSVHGDLGG